MTENEVTTIPDSDVQVYQNASPAQMMQMALAQKGDLTGLKEMLELQKDWEAHEAKKAYVKAMSKFRAEGVVVRKDRHNKQYDSMYTSIGNLVNTAIPALSKHGLSHKWETLQENNAIRVTCVMTHEDGHSESTTMEGPPDDSGKKNALQQIKSTMTYLKLATFEAITGLASIEGNLDDDGNNAAPQPEYITEAQAIQLTDMAEAAKGGIQKFEKYLNGLNPAIESIDKIPAKAFDTFHGILLKAQPK